MTDLDIPSPTAMAVPTADVVAPAGNVGPIVHQSFPLRQPEEDADEIMVSVRGTILRRARTRLRQIVTNRFPWPEVLLGVATLSLGGALGALGSRLPWAVVTSGTPGSSTGPGLQAIVFYVTLPVIGAAALVGFLCLRHFTARNASEVALSILDELPDPDRTR